MKTFFYRIFALAFRLFRLLPPQKNKVALLAPHRELGSLAAVRDALEASWRVAVLRVHAPLRHPLRLFTADAYHLATAGAVFLNDNFMPLGDLHFRPGVRVIQLWHGEGAFKRFGLSLPLEPRLAARVRRGGQRLTAVVCAAPPLVPYYAEAFGVPPACVLPLGSPRVDALVRPTDSAALRRAWDAKFPACAGKRLLLYAPTFRDDPGENDALLSHFDFAAFADRFGGNTILLLRLHAKQTGALPALPPCVLDVTQARDGLAILRLCDGLISDYSSLCMEAALLDIPVFCYVYDYAAYAAKRGFYMPLRDLPPGAVAETFPALLDAIAAPDTWAAQRQSFARFHLGEPDGKATERVIGLLTMEHAGAVTG
ncbi:MAG: CDP-glycerol glycerophosphotransferase family protein [Oscillospiraceae bacterium]|jgi:CDP-ribitol ribitolphosphotransferase|nr:CDP-glycerol glycerophosphotransferase family protein [Oscillospiraceae bacterium]